MNADPTPRRAHVRWRLTIAFILVSGISAGVLASGSFILVRIARHEAFLERSLRDAALSHSIAESRLTPSTQSGISEVLARLRARNGLRAVAVTPDGTFSNGPQIGLDELPRPSDGEERQHGMTLEYWETNVEGHPFLVVSPSQEIGDARLYFFYARGLLLAGLRDLARVMLQLWVIVVVASALVGNLLARRTLRPVARASSAARSIAEGLLETRLPIESRDEFGGWATSFNEMAQALEEKISDLVAAREREHRFTSDVAHELKTPLTALVSSASLVGQRLDEMDPETRWGAERMINEVRRLRSLVDELIEISKVHAGRESIHVEGVDIGELAQQVIVTRRWESQVRVSTANVHVMTDKRRVERIVANLISNAVTHGGKGIEVRVGSADGSAVVEVSDRGPGIAADQMPRLFDRFYKVDPSRPGGAGLGLSIAAENARLLGGRIAVESEEGAGATFTLVLPRVPSVEN